MTNTIELLSPARNSEIGIEAIRHGADAVYIGADRFGARAAAGNSVADIERLASFAHQYSARVFVTINTLMTDQELDDARTLAWQLYEAGTDAFIIQDTRFALMDLPPVELHASTQCDIRTKERVAELRALGFTQMVLARELSIPEIKTIADSTDAVIETFCHGALCVCYSGRCFMSEAVTGRSANRGECAQMCRLPYDLLNSEGETLLHNKHLLSLKDFDASLYLADLLNAGVRCLKIEGRLKDVNYVKNITAYYRQRLDDILCNDAASHLSNTLHHRSLGEVSFNFTPDVRRTFYRGGTDYFLSGKRPLNMCTMVTGKAMGEPITPSTPLHNGDGVCWFQNDELRGCQIDGKQRLPKGIQLYRNNDIEFERLLNSNSADRKIPISLEITETPDGFSCSSFLQTSKMSSSPSPTSKMSSAFSASLRDEKPTSTCSLSFGYPSLRSLRPLRDIKCNITVPCDKQPANDPSKILDTWHRTLSKTGDTEFRVDNITLNFSQPWFLPVSKIAEIRRSLISSLRLSLTSASSPQTSEMSSPPTSEMSSALSASSASLRDKKPTSTCSVSLGYPSLRPLRALRDKKNSPSLPTPKPCNVAEYGVIPDELMRCRYCIRYEIGQCLKNKNSYRGDLFLRNSAGRTFRLAFDCKHCEMVVK